MLSILNMNNKPLAEFLSNECTKLGVEFLSLDLCFTFMFLFQDNKLKLH